MDDQHETIADLDAAPDAVWEVLTDPEGVESWLGDGSTIDPVEGGAIDAVDSETGVPRHGRVDHVEPGRRLSYTWWPADEAPARHRATGDGPDGASHVTIELIPNGAGTRLVITERRPVASAWAWAWRVASVELALYSARLAV